MRINVSNFEEVQEALDEVQGRARCHIYQPQDILDRVGYLEAKLAVLPKRYHKGVKAYIADWPKGSASYPNIGTVATVERGVCDWFVTNIKRDYRPAISPRIESHGDAFDAVMRHNGFIVETSYSIARI